MSDGREFLPSDLQLWRKYKRFGRKDTRAAHRWLPGLNRANCCMATDFCIANNFWPVQFERDGDPYDLTIVFILAFWCCYTNAMHGRPDFTTNAAQKVRMRYVLRCMRYTM